ncbi:hypothetical protein EAL2_c11130 [Peptoclostridium acidaminophilum DSM 3953]|uniref:Phage XkdN-like protein n=1 Tax=Peptoclostridium acidaminophilum DSM 3953 TaxID=1286171 RepID=W8U662_PEPAC|nr:hypothetical protein [Peptoclostridium acidaminophilum]AHM56411.1 hypothetical protein EAL2_c11130 [Peptoclostridium acidaminophilum DSM 3953]
MNNKKLTLGELISKKTQIKEAKEKTAEKFVKSLDGTVTIKILDRSFISDCTEMENGEGNAHIVYEGIVEPNLKDTQLHEAYGIKNPADIVDMIFLPGEVDFLSGEIVKLSGYDSDSIKDVVEEVKN